MKKYIIFLAIISFKLCAQQADILIKQGDIIYPLPRDTALQSPVLKEAFENLPGETFLVPENMPMQDVTKLIQTFEKYKNLSGKALLDAVETEMGAHKLTKELLNASDYLAFTPGIELIARSFARSKPNIQQLKENFNDHVISVIAHYYYLLHERDLEGINPETLGFSFQDYADYLPHVVTPEDNKLNLSNRRLNHISPNDLKAFSNLQELFLDHNQLKNLAPQTFSGLPNLQELYLEDNQLKNLAPQIFSGLINLKVLYLHSNQLKELDPQTFSTLTNLQSLYLSNNQLKELDPQTFSSLTNLQRLDLEDNQLKKLDPQIFSILINLKVLYLSYNQLKQLDPQTFSTLTNLEELYLHDNQLQNLAPEIFSILINLKVLYLSDNQLKNLAPQTFSSLTNLQRLDLEDNQLKELDPQTFSGLTNLKRLELSDNQLEELDPQIFSSLNLQKLYLGNNALSVETKERLRKIYGSILKSI